MVYLHLFLPSFIVAIFDNRCFSSPIGPWSRCCRKALWHPLETQLIFTFGHFCVQNEICQMLDSHLQHLINLLSFFFGFISENHCKSQDLYTFLTRNDGHSRLGAEDGLAFASVHGTGSLELVLWLQRLGYEGNIYFDTFPKNEDPVKEAELNIRRFLKLWEKAEKMDEKLKKLQEKRDAMAVMELLDEHWLRWRCSSMFVKDGKPVGFSVLRWAWLPNLIPLTVAKHLEPVQGAFLHQCPTDRRWKTQPWKTHARVNVLCIISYKRRSWCDLWRPEKRRKKTKKNCAAGSLQGAEYFDIGKVGFSIFCFLYAGCDSTNSSFCMRTSLKS